MLTIRKSNERGHVKMGWLDTHHSFSFGSYHDPRYMGFGRLRVINDDIIAGGGGFAPHSHQDMEIITYMLDGALAHQDSIGNGSTIQPGDIQRMSAGRGITHSEFNSSKSEAAHLLQIWLLPEKDGIPPSYAQQAIDRSRMKNNWLPVASEDGREGSISLNVPTTLYAILLDKGKEVTYKADPKLTYWLQVARGNLKLGDQKLQAGDGVAISAETSLIVTGEADIPAEVLLFEGL